MNLLICVINTGIADEQHND